MWAKRKQSGFTIVELLIVIVVIGILASLTIVAYNGIQQKAQVATLQSDLEGAAKQLTIDQVTNSAYPATLAAANNGAGLKTSPGNTYNYIVNNSITPVYFCLAETNTASNLTYFVNSTNNTPQAGGCSVTNLITNPNFGSNSTTGYRVNCSTGGSISLSTDRAHIGTQSLKVVSDSAASHCGVVMPISSPIDGKYTFSAWVYIPSTGGFTQLIPAVWSSVFTSGPAITARDQWVHVSITAPVVAGTANWYLYDSGTTGSEATGNVFYVNQTMQTQGSTLYTYADGSSPNWSWTGTPNASTSTGPAL
jgi:general secretion pathway protein G